MTGPDPALKPPPNPNLPIGWLGGNLEVLEASVPDYYDERHAVAERVEEMTSWTPLEDLEAGDPPEPWGELDVGSTGPPVPAAVEVVSGVVAHVAATGTGVILEEFAGEWLDLSKFVPGLTLEGVARGDVLVAEVETGRNGRRYIRQILLRQGPGE